MHNYDEFFIFLSLKLKKIKKGDVTWRFSLDKARNIRAGFFMIIFVMLFTGLIFFGAAIYRKKFMDMIMKGIQGGSGSFMPDLQSKFRNSAGQVAMLLTGQHHLQRGLQKRGSFNRSVPNKTQSSGVKETVPNEKNNGIGLETSLSGTPGWLKERSDINLNKNYPDKEQYNIENADHEHENEYPDQEADINRGDQWAPGYYPDEGQYSPEDQYNQEDIESPVNDRFYENKHPEQAETNFGRENQRISIPVAANSESKTPTNKLEREPAVFLQGTSPGENLSSRENSINQEKSLQGAEVPRSHVLSDQNIPGKKVKDSLLNNKRESSVSENARDVSVMPAAGVSVKSGSMVDTPTTGISLGERSEKGDPPIEPPWVTPVPKTAVPNAEPLSNSSATRLSEGKDQQFIKNAWDTPSKSVGNFPARPEPATTISSSEEEKSRQSAGFFGNAPTHEPNVSNAGPPVNNSAPVVSLEKNKDQQPKSAWDTPVTSNLVKPKPAVNIPAVSTEKAENQRIKTNVSPSKSFKDQQPKSAWDTPVTSNLVKPKPAVNIPAVSTEKAENQREDND